MSFTAYQTYKDTGLEWLGSVPSHWKQMPFFSLVRERQDTNLGMKNENLLSLSYGRIVPKDLDTLDGLLPASFETYQIVQPGDIVFRLTDLQNDKRSLRSAIVSEEGIITSAYLAVQCRKIIPQYANYVFRAYDLSKVFYSMGGGLRQSMKFSDMKWLPIFLPEEDEQTQIARFLDYETARIDALIEEQQRLIELLKEKRQAVISHAVTKGLDPNVPMKDSGVEWLGEVPEHWAVCKLGMRYSIDLGKMLDEKRNIGKHPLPYLRNQDVQWGEININDLPLIDVLPHEHQRYTLQRGDLLVCEGGDVGRAAIWEAPIEPIAYQKALHRLRPQSSQSDTSEFLYFELLAAKAYGVYEESEAKATISHLTAEKFRQYKFAFPPLNEQKKIARYLKEEQRASDNLLNEAQSLTKLLKERRTALISAAVTGKVDVRNWQAPADKNKKPAQQEAAHG